VHDINEATAYQLRDMIHTALQEGEIFERNSESLAQQAAHWRALAQSWQDVAAAMQQALRDACAKSNRWQGEAYKAAVETANSDGLVDDISVQLEAKQAEIGVITRKNIEYQKENQALAAECHRLSVDRNRIEIEHAATVDQLTKERDYWQDRATRAGAADLPEREELRDALATRTQERDQALHREREMGDQRDDLKIQVQAIVADLTAAQAKAASVDRDLSDARSNYAHEINGVRALLDEARRELDGLRRRDMQGAALIAAERLRQVTEEGYTAEHDDQETDGELAEAAAWYTVPEETVTAVCWPWPDRPTPRIGDRTRDLVIAGALCAAEIDRLERMEARTADAPEHEGVWQDPTVLKAAS